MREYKQGAVFKPLMRTGDRVPGLKYFFRSIWALRPALKVGLLILTLGGADLAISSSLQAAQSLALGQVEQSTLTLSLSGPDGTAYEGTCRITRSGREEEMVMKGTVPEDFSFEGEALTCDLRSDGRLTVQAQKDDGNVSRSTTSGGRVRLSIR